MEIIDLNQYIKPELLILLPFLVGIGKIIKTSALSDKHIPLILLAISIVSSCAWLFIMESENLANSIVMGTVQGGIIAAVSVYGHQVFKQYGGKPSDADEAIRLAVEKMSKSENDEGE